MIVLVTGGRVLPEDLTPDLALQMALRSLGKHAEVGDVIHHGAAQGFDSIAAAAAQALGFAIYPHHPNWRLYGKRAGLLRNQEMASLPGVRCLIAFPGGTGTADMTKRCELRGLPVQKAE